MWCLRICPHQWHHPRRHPFLAGGTLGGDALLPPPRDPLVHLFGGKGGEAKASLTAHHAANSLRLWGQGSLLIPGAEGGSAPVPRPVPASQIELEGVGEAGPSTLPGAEQPWPCSSCVSQASAANVPVAQPCPHSLGHQLPCGIAPSA